MQKKLVKILCHSDLKPRFPSRLGIIGFECTSDNFCQITTSVKVCRRFYLSVLLNQCSKNGVERYLTGNVSGSSHLETMEICPSSIQKPSRRKLSSKVQAWKDSEQNYVVINQNIGKMAGNLGLLGSDVGANKFNFLCLFQLERVLWLNKSFEESETTQTKFSAV